MGEHELWAAPPLAAGTDEADRPALTDFPLASPGPVPAMLVVPGGGYARNAEHEGEPVARWLNTLGVAAFVLRYRVAPYRYPVPLLDAQRAVRYIRHHADRFGVDPGRLGVLGFSAGGHLAGLVATGDGTPVPDGRPSDAIDREDPRPGLAVLCYPVASMDGPAHHGSMDNLLGSEPSEELRRSLSIELRITPAGPPTFVWATADDPVVDAANARLVAEALKRQGVPHELHIFPHGPHGLGLAEGVPVVSEWTRSCAAFLSTHGW